VGCHGRGCAVRKECWARKQAKRKGKDPNKKYYCKLCYEFIPHLHRERLKEPAHLKKSSIIGLNFMGDTFDDDVHVDWMDEIMQMVKESPQHIFIVFTKQPQNIPDWFVREAPPNLWVGVSINRRADLWRMETLKKLQLPMKVISFEPLLEDMGDVDLDGINWVIIGAQTRPTVKPDNYWVWSLRNEAILHDISVFMKNNLAPAWSTDDQMKQFPIHEATWPREK
jgi:protein gp37